MVGLKVPVDNMAFLEFGDEEELLLDFTRLDSRHAQYRWRQRLAGIEDDVLGTGHVWEVMSRFGCIRMLDVKRSQTFISTVNVDIGWSYASLTSSWIYVDTTRTQVGLLSDDYFSNSWDEIHERELGCYEPD